MRRINGQALIPVVFVVLILTALAVSFAVSASREIRAAQNYCADTQQRLIARGALQRALAILSETGANGAAHGTLPIEQDADANGWRPVGDFWLKVEAIDTASRLNVNTLPKATLARLPALQAHPDVVAAIVDWRSAGEQPSANGAKSDYYRSLTTPYPSKDGPLDTVDELLLVKGVTPTLLFDPPPSGALPPTSEPTEARQFDDIFARSTLPLSNLLATYVRERNVSTTGAARVNVNTASLNDLTRIGLTGQQAQNLLDYRGGGVAPTTSEGTDDKLGETASPNPGASFSFTAPSTAPSSGTTASTTGDQVVPGQNLRTIGDLMEVPGFNRSVMSKIADSVTVSDDPYRYDVVNVNTASPEALASVPGMSRRLLEAIVAFRNTGRAFQTLGDLFRLTGITRKQYEAVLGKLSAKSSAYEIRVRVAEPGSPTIFTATALAELTDNGPRILQWREGAYPPGPLP